MMISGNFSRASLNTILIRTYNKHYKYDCFSAADAKIQITLEEEVSANIFLLF